MAFISLLSKILRLFSGKKVKSGELQKEAIHPISSKLLTAIDTANQKNDLLK